MEEVKKNCEHLDFAANVAVNRLTKGEGGPVTAYLAEIHVTCAQCQMPFIFVGAPMGLIWDGPAVSPNGQELRAPLRPRDEFAESAPDLPGYRIRVSGRA